MVKFFESTEIMTALTPALREVVIAISTPVTVEAVIVVFTRTVASADFTDCSLGTVHVTFTGDTVGVTIVTYVTLVTVETRELRSALAAASVLLTFTSGE